jgi:hypothetical protein
MAATTRRWRVAAWSTAASLLLLPLIAMQFTDEVTWDLADFALAGALIASAGTAYELAAARATHAAYRAGAAVALATTLILIWGNLAVGIIGSEDNPANAMYAGVLAVGIIGSFIARWRPLGMARALIATAMAQALVAVIAQVAGWGSAGPITVFFVALWLLSAWLFRKSAHDRRSAGAVP